MQPRSLADWLAYQERLHPSAIDLGLERLTSVLSRLGWRGIAVPVVTVGGTNGKGSCVALLASILSANGYRVGTFTSPHLLRYNERIHIAGQQVSDTALIAAFERIEAARGDVSITFFEFNTLAALLIFEQEKLDVIVLEVGLGGLLDAVNVIDADVSIVTSVALDHCEWLGHDLDSIARWKAGIFRANRPAVFGARAMPAAIAEEARRIGATLLRLGVDFDFVSQEDAWEWHGRIVLRGLPMPALPGTVQLDNAATVLTGLDCLSAQLPLSRISIERGLRTVALAGRFQAIPSRTRAPREWLLDVAHNPAAAAVLAENLKSRPCAGKTIAVCGMFADKDVAGVISAVAAQIDVWVVATANGARALPAEQMAERVSSCCGKAAAIAADVASACSYAQSIATAEDRIVAFGSFQTVGPALAWLGQVQVN